MLSFAKNPFMPSVVVLNVIMLNVVASLELRHRCFMRVTSVTFNVLLIYRDLRYQKASVFKCSTSSLQVCQLRHSSFNSITLKRFTMF